MRSASIGCAPHHPPQQSNPTPDAPTSLVGAARLPEELSSVGTRTDPRGDATGDPLAEDDPKPKWSTCPIIKYIRGGAGWDRCALARSFGIAPFPVPDFRQVLAVLVDVMLVLNEFVPHRLLPDTLPCCPDAAAGPPRLAQDESGPRSFCTRISNAVVMAPSSL